MAKIVFPDSFISITGVREIDSAAANYRDLVKQLQQQWPELTELLEKSSVAIDGQIYQDAFLEVIEPSSEVFFMARIEGG